MKNCDLMVALRGIEIAEVEKEKEKDGKTGKVPFMLITV